MLYSFSLPWGYCHIFSQTICSDLVLDVVLEALEPETAAKEVSIQQINNCKLVD